MNNRYLDYNGLQHVAEYVNKKLTITSTVPSSPIDGQTMLYVGTSTALYAQGGIYEYNSANTSWELKNMVQTVELTQAEYDALTPAEQNSGVIYFITDAEVPSSFIVNGYYNSLNNKFYKESTYTTEILGNKDSLYVSFNDNSIYRYDENSSRFIQVSNKSNTFNANDFSVVSNEVSLATKQRSFVGTRAQWELLTEREKALYGTVSFIGGEGYYNNNNNTLERIAENDAWTAISQVDSENIVAFTGLNDAYGYALYVEDKLAIINDVKKVGGGNSMSLTYTLSEVETGDNCRLRILR